MPEHCHVRPAFDGTAGNWMVDVYDGRGAWTATLHGQYTKEQATRRARNYMAGLRREAKRKGK